MRLRNLEMGLEQKILLASIRELNELVLLSISTQQLNSARINLTDLKERVRKYGDNNTSPSDSGVESDSD